MNSSEGLEQGAEEFRTSFDGGFRCPFICSEVVFEFCKDTHAIDIVPIEDNNSD